MTDFLLELLSEEIPARMQAKAATDLGKLFADEIAKSGLKAASIETYATPRRLALMARALPLQTDSVREERKGPRADAPEQALAGFLRSTGLSREQLEERDDGKGNKILFAVFDKPGRQTAEVLAEAVPAVVRAFPWPKSMRWGKASSSTESLRWVRPLQGIIALLGDDLVDIDIDGVKSGFTTLGHRFHHPDVVTIGNAADYAMKLRAAHVILDPKERQQIIRDGAAKVATDAGLVLVEDEGLVAENAGLTEWPVPMLGRFDASFLAVPEEVIQLTARINQKYFICRDANGKLANAFVCTANIQAIDGGAAIVAGNQKVLAARLSDAKFFYEQDLKIPLDEQARKLADIVFHEKIGTVADKVARVAELARWLIEKGVVPGRVPGADPEPNGLPLAQQHKAALADMAERAAKLAKADLVTGMVGEFPELQGVMGGYYAAAQNEKPEVANAVRDHYKPAGQGDDVPTDAVTVAVSLADKLDSLNEFFRIDEKPTGSKDPFALRRSALGVISLIETNGLRFPLNAIGADQNGVLAFMLDRLKVQQKEAGVRHDLIDAVAALGGEDDLVRLLARVHALQGFVSTDDGTNLLAGYKRAANILKKELPDGAIAARPPHDGLEAAERALLAALDAAEPQARAAVEAEQFETAMSALASLRAPIDAFFDGVMVNDPDADKRAFRLNLLARFRDAVHSVADFSKIEG
jgi:glycyl-tRNA synthetase beta chain